MRDTGSFFLAHKPVPSKAEGDASATCCQGPGGVPVRDAPGLCLWPRELLRVRV